MAKLVLLNKPYDVLCQFTDDEARSTLADFISDASLSKVYPAGRLDRDSEGLVLLTDNGVLQHQIAHPSQGKQKVYWVQVEGEVSEQAIQQLRSGVELKDGMTKPAEVTRIEEPSLWARSKPVRFRANIPTTWLSIGISEGKNRQVRRMTAAVGFPTLRLVRYSIGRWNLLNPECENPPMLQPGEYLVLEVATPPAARHSKFYKKPNSRTPMQKQRSYRKRRPKT